MFSMFKLKGCFYKSVVLIMCYFFAPSVVFANDLFLGLIVGESKDEVVVVSVKKESLAFNAGIRSDDIILSVNGEDVFSGGDYLDIVNKSSNEKTITFAIERVGEVLEIVIESSDDKVDKSPDVKGKVKIDKYQFLKASIFYKTGISFSEQGFGDEAIGSFEKATNSYRRAIEKNSLTKNDLLVIGKNLKEMVVQLKDLDAASFLIAETKATEKTVEKEISAISVQMLDGKDKASGIIEKENKTPILAEESVDEGGKEDVVPLKDVAKKSEVEKETVQPEIGVEMDEDVLENVSELKDDEDVEIDVGDDMMLVEKEIPVLELKKKVIKKESEQTLPKTDFKDASVGEFWIIESTTILLKQPDMSGKLIDNLIAGISAGTTVEILDTKVGFDKWVNVNVYNKNNMAYRIGWIRAMFVGKARQK